MSTSSGAPRYTCCTTAVSYGSAGAPARMSLADLKNLRQLEIVHDRCRFARGEIVSQAQHMADFVRHDVSQVIVLLFQIAIHHRFGQDEDMRVEDLSRQWIALDIGGGRELPGGHPLNDVVVGARRADAREARR